jgi:hypothetical protein
LDQLFESSDFEATSAPVVAEIERLRWLNHFRNLATASIFGRDLAAKDGETIWRDTSNELKPSLNRAYSGLNTRAIYPAFNIGSSTIFIREKFGSLENWVFVGYDERDHARAATFSLFEALNSFPQLPLLDIVYGGHD